MKALPFAIVPPCAKTGMRTYVLVIASAFAAFSVAASRADAQGLATNLPGAKGPLFESVAKSDPAALRGDVAAQLKDLKLHKPPQSRAFASDIKSVWVGVMFDKSLEGKAIAFDVQDSNGPVALERQPVIYERNDKTGELAAVMPLVPRAGRFERGAYQARVKLDGKLVAHVNWEFLRPAAAAQGGATTDEQQQAVALIQRLGGKVERDDKLAGQPVVRVDLSYTRVADSDLACLRVFDQLRRLDLSLNKLSGAGFVHLQRLPALKTLVLSYTSFSDDSLAHVAKLAQLEKLWLARTAVTDKGLGHLQELKNLQGINVSSDAVTDRGLAALRDLTKLREVHLGSRGITDRGLAQLANLTDLQELYLEAPITGSGFVHLRGMKKLKTLQVHGCAVTDKSLVHLQALPTLGRLDIVSRALTDKGIEQLQGLPALAELAIGGPSLTDAGLVHLRQLEKLTHLVLYGDTFTDGGLVHLQRLQRLQSLTLFSCKKLTNEGIADLEKARPELIIVGF